MTIPPMATRHEKPDRKCQTCAFFFHFGKGSDAGQCRRYAPRPTIDHDPSHGILISYWPDVSIDEFCGEWSAT